MLSNQIADCKRSSKIDLKPIRDGAIANPEHGKRTAYDMRWQGRGFRAGRGSKKLLPLVQAWTQIYWRRNGAWMRTSCRGLPVRWGSVPSAVPCCPPTSWFCRCLFRPFLFSGINALHPIVHARIQRLVATLAQCRESLIDTAAQNQLQ